LATHDQYKRLLVDCKNKENGMKFLTRNVAWWLVLAPLSAASAQQVDSSATNRHGSSLGLVGVPAAMPRVVNVSSPNALSPELIETIAAQGSIPLENPTATISHYGFHADGALVPSYGDVQSATHNVEATKSEPDKNTYLVLSNQKGADPRYDYGTHFMFQGHELGLGYITRINLDADFAHRVTLMAAADVNAVPLPPIDGSTWDPFAKRLVFSAEGSATTGGLWQATLDVPSQVQDISGAVGRGGYEGIQNDPSGNLWIVEDSGGAKGASINKNAKQPNSFIYRFVPKNPSDLTKGKLQALQVLSKGTGQPITFHAGQADADITSQDTADMRAYGNALDTTWVTLHDTDVDGATPYDANALAKAKSATPFKRPENGQFRPGTDFKEFYFDETGDTDARTEAGSALGGFGSIFKLRQSGGPAANSGKLSIVYQGDLVHSSFDNCAFWDKDHVVFVEDAGDTLHGQRNALDSAWLFDLTVDYSNPKNQPLRLVAEGRDTAATIDTLIAGQPGFQNEGDNEITGFHVSNGDPSANGLLGASQPHPFKNGWRVFYTQQHGENFTWEILANQGSNYDD
jgi:hypothetical protein